MILILTVSAALHAQPVLVKEISSASTNFTAIGDFVFFTSGDSLYRTEGSAEGTIFLKKVSAASLQDFNGDLYFLVTDSDGTELWTSDGTPEGTILLDTYLAVTFLQSSDNFLYFVASTVGTGRELYRTNGTPGGTILLSDINPGPAHGIPDDLDFVQNRLRRDFPSGVVGNVLFFAADNGTHGTELWKTDGSPGGTMMVQDINPGAGDGFAAVAPLAFNGKFYFRGLTPENGAEPWVSDGTSEGTILLTDIASGPGSPQDIEFKISHNEVVYFMAYAFDDQADQRGAGDLWKTSGTPESTTYIRTIGFQDYTHHSFLAYQEKVYFFAWAELSMFGGVDHELWVTDGTTSGTESIFFLTTYIGGLEFFEVVNDFLLFYGTYEHNPTPLIRSDGTRSGTEVVSRFQAAWLPQWPRDMTKVNDLVFFGDHEEADFDTGFPIDQDDYYQLIQSDGFTTQSIRSLHGGSYAGTDNIVGYKGRVLFTTHDDQFGSTDTQKRLWIYDPTQPPQDSASFTLVNADTDEDIQTLTEGDTITKSADTFFNIRYNPVGSPGSVVFKHEGKVVRTENAAPFALRGDYSGNYLPWEAAVSGSHKVAATPYTDAGGKGTAGPTLMINFTIEEDAGACLASGTILHEYWAGVPGSRISNIPLDTEPTSMSELTLFEGPENIGTNYAARIRGYICPPATGDYVFWIASNDHSELWLSTDDNPSNKIKLGHVTGATNPRQWDKFVSQRSSPIALERGNRYYIEVLHKQGVGTDHIAVGWQLPDGTIERPIPGIRLSPFESNTSTMASMADARYSQINIYPNPAPGGASELRIAGYEGIKEIVETQVEIINLTGEVIFAERISCGRDCSSYLIDVKKQLVPGLYLVNFHANGIRSSKRLLVK